jgi:hypothetical protein
MAAALLGCVIAAGLPAGAGEAPFAWSQDGRWVAYVLAERPATNVLPPGRVLDPTDAAPVPGAPAPCVYRLWATQPETGESVLLAESARALTSPAWNPGGPELAYGRLARVEGGRARFEIVVQESLDRRRVIDAQEIGVDRPELDAVLAGAAVAFSPDGRHLAVPRVEPMGIAILRVDRGTVLKVLEGASGLGWSPAGQHAAFYRDGALYLLDTGFAEPRRVIVAPDAERLPPVQWTRDGRSMVIVFRGSRLGLGRRRPGPPGERLELVQIDAETGQVIPMRSLLNGPVLEPDSFRSASFALDPTGEQLFFTTTIRGQTSQITWAASRQNVVKSRFNPADEELSLGDLALSPDGSRLALRVGGEPCGLAALCDPATTRLVPLAPDDDARAAWVAQLAATADSILAAISPHTADGTTLERIIALPSPAELDAQTVLLPRLRHLALVGRPVVDRPVGSAPAPPELETALGEARLAFAYWNHDPDQPRGSFEAARKILEGLEATIQDPAAQTPLLHARALIAIGLGDRDGALATIESLRAGQPARRQQIEETALGLVLTELPDPERAWLAQMETEAQTARSERRAKVPAAPAPELEPLLELRGRVDEVPVLPAP